MIKIMLVEDDKSLREIYGVRLLAEGYDIVSAGDGEEALAIAIKERPGLIISDVMMPKVSGYDMLDILRSTTETRNIRVIMMTALSSEEQRARAESLGADRYLVKSQVGIEDVVRVVHEVLEDIPVATPAPGATTATTPAQPAPSTTPAGITTPPQPLPTPSTTTTAPNSAAATPAPPVPALSPVAPINDAPKPASIKTRVIQPLNDPNVTAVNLNDLLDKELAKEAGISDELRPVVETVSQEKAAIDEQLRAFVPPSLEPVIPPAPPSPVANSDNQTTPTLPIPGIGSQTPSPATPTQVNPPAVPAPVPASPPLTTLPTPVPVVAATPVLTPTPVSSQTPPPQTPPAPSAAPLIPSPTPQTSPAPVNLPEVPNI